MIENKHVKYAPFESNFLSVTFDKQRGSIAFLGIESGGRDRDKHASYNLLIPSYGAQAGIFKKSLPVSCEINDDTIAFTSKEGNRVSYEITGTHTFKAVLQDPSKNDIFSTRLSVKTAPPTIWTKNQPKRLKSQNPLTIHKSKFELPLTIHFPDFGRLKIFKCQGTLLVLSLVEKTSAITIIEFTACIMVAHF